MITLYSVLQNVWHCLNNCTVLFYIILCHSNPTFLSLCESITSVKEKSQKSNLRDDSVKDFYSKALKLPFCFHFHPLICTVESLHFKYMYSQSEYRLDLVKQRKGRGVQISEFFLYYIILYVYIPFVVNTFKFGKITFFLFECRKYNKLNHLCVTFACVSFIYMCV